MSGIRVNEANACNGASGEEPAICNKHEHLAGEINGLNNVLREIYNLRDKISGSDLSFILELYEPDSLVSMLDTAPSELDEFGNAARNIIADIEKLLFK